MKILELNLKKFVADLDENIIGFLNSKDRENIYIGVADNGKIIGLNVNGNIDLLQRKIKNRIISNIELSITYYFLDLIGFR